MNPELISHYLPLLVSYAIIVGLFCKNRHDVKRLQKEALRKQEAAVDGMATLSRQVEGIRESVRHIEENPAPMEVVGQGFHPAKREQVLRLYHRGESVPRIAAALRAPASEVRLVLKVHQLLHSEN